MTGTLHKAFQLLVIMLDDNPDSVWDAGDDADQNGNKKKHTDGLHILIPPRARSTLLALWQQHHLWALCIALSTFYSDWPYLLPITLTVSVPWQTLRPLPVFAKMSANPFTPDGATYLSPLQRKAPGASTITRINPRRDGGGMGRDLYQRQPLVLCRDRERGGMERTTTVIGEMR